MGCEARPFSAARYIRGLPPCLGRKPLKLPFYLALTFDPDQPLSGANRAILLCCKRLGVNGHPRSERAGGTTYGNILSLLATPRDGREPRNGVRLIPWHHVLVRIDANDESLRESGC